MLRTNLATRPFYNERAVRVALAVVTVLTAALTAFNAAQIYSLNARNTERAQRADAAEARAAELRADARVIRQALDRQEVSVVQAASREANMLIERRAFSWTDLFNRFEETLPAGVRILAVQPQMDDQGRMLVAITLIAREFEDVSTFQDLMEATGTFRGFVSRDSAAQDDGTTRAVIQGYYTPATAVAPPPTSESTGAGATGSASAPAPAPGVGR